MTKETVLLCRFIDHCGREWISERMCFGGKIDVDRIAKMILKQYEPHRHLFVHIESGVPDEPFTHVRYCFKNQQIET